MNPERPRVSVVMPMYDSTRFIGAALESVLAQTFRDFELLVVDDASTDDGAAVAASFPDPRIRLFRQDEQGGPAVARNRALTEARGEFIAFFDSDDVALPTWLAESMAFLGAHADCDIVGAWVETIDEYGASTGARNAYQDRPEKIAAIMLFTNCLPTSTLLMRRCCLEGRKFDETMPVASDYELWVQLVPWHRALILQRVLARYRVHPQNITCRKNASASECLRRIARLQLDRLGLAPTDAEISLHLQLCKFTFGTSMETVLAVESWLMKLEEANARTTIYLPQPFRVVLGERWFTACHSACGHAFWTWRRFRRSPLAGWFKPSPAKRRQFFLMCLRGALKKLFVSSRSQVTPEHPAKTV